MARFAAVDVDYPNGGGACAALVVCTDATFGPPFGETVVTVGNVAEYRPGAFFERELPCIEAVIAHERGDALELLIVDGYVDLDPDGRAGLGRRAHEALGGIPVVGVAKTRFAPATHALEVSRAGIRPLFVTAAGIDVADAAALVSSMAGSFRMPDALRQVDRLARGGR